MMTRRQKLAALISHKEELLNKVKHVEETIKKMQRKIGVVFYVDEDSKEQIPVFFVENLPSDISAKEFKELVIDAVLEETGKVGNHLLVLKIGLKDMSNFVKAVYFEGSAWSDGRLYHKTVYFYDYIKKRVEELKEAE